MPESPNAVRPTQVWFVTGRKENKAFREFVPPKFVRHETTLSDNKENIPPEDDTKEDAKHNESKEAR